MKTQDEIFLNQAKEIARRRGGCPSCMCCSECLIILKSDRRIYCNDEVALSIATEYLMSHCEYCGSKKNDGPGICPVCHRFPSRKYAEKENREVR